MQLASSCLVGIGSALFLFSLLHAFRGRWVSFFGWSGLANGVDTLGLALIHDYFAYFSAGTCAFALWMWWKGGGGDKTKRRLKSLASKFQPVRRTAPAVGGA